MSQILLSIVVATYNRLPELKTMLDSLLPQVEGKPVEMLIADDQSTDDTWSWLQSRFTGVPGIQIFRTEKNGGPGPARNLCIEAAKGQYFMPVDSDFIVMEGSIDKVLAALQDNHRHHLLFFTCVQYPAMLDLGGLKGSREITYEDLLSDAFGEAVPVASLSWLRHHGARYPSLRAGGESLLWAEMLLSGPAYFVDSPVVLYRTDSTNRICTLKYQLEHPADLAAVADAMVSLLSRTRSRVLRHTRARKLLAAGAYHLLAGNMRTGRRRLFSAASLGSMPAIAAIGVSFAGRDLFRILFRVYRTRLAKAYL